MGWKVLCPTIYKPKILAEDAGHISEGNRGGRSWPLDGQALLHRCQAHPHWQQGRRCQVKADGRFGT